MGAGDARSAAPCPLAHIVVHRGPQFLLPQSEGETTVGALNSVTRSKGAWESGLPGSMRPIEIVLSSAEEIKLMFES